MKLGTFFSTCDGVISEKIDLHALAKEWVGIPSVTIVDNFYHGEDYDKLLKEVKDKNLDSIVLAGKSPFTYHHTRNGDFLFNILAKNGVNPNRIEVVNIKNMVVLPHNASSKELHQKAKLLVDVGIERLRHAERITTVEISPRKSAAVIGADLSSLAVSQLLIDEGCKVFLIHEEDELTFPPDEVDHIKPTLAYLTHHSRFTLLSKTEVKDFYGFTGDYTLSLESEESTRDLRVGAVVISVGKDDKKLIQKAHSVFHVDIHPDGSLIPLDKVSASCRTQERGVFIINTSNGPDRGPAEKFMAADAAGSMAINMLNKFEIHENIMVSQVNKAYCSGCGACVKTCVFNAVSLNGGSGVSVIDPKRCRGCGNCVAACPADARSLTVCPTDYLFNAVDILARFEPVNNAPKTLVLTCDGCGYPGLDRAAEQGMTWPVSALPLRMVCGGQMDTQLIMHAFVKGFDKVVLIVCNEGFCHNIIGNVALERRTHLFKEILASRGSDPENLHVLTTNVGDEASLVKNINMICG
ncbi:MAG: hydrogenase iron-sulfur subunit [Desulfobacterales bacterium]|nr:hydrogenase iron-sulfur subunit [Desulfobacterales bacterium]